MYFGKGILEPWFFQNPRKFRTLVYLELEAYSEHCQTNTMKRFEQMAT